MSTLPPRHRRPLRAGLALAALALLAPPVAHGQRVEDMVRALSRSPSTTRQLKEESNPVPDAPTPQQARPAPPLPQVQGCNLPLPKMEFAFGSDKLNGLGLETARKLGIALASADLAGGRFLLIGHTDAVGSDEDNLDLSRRRAATVRDFLVREAQIDPARLATEGRGERDLALPRDPTNGANRRVEVRWADGC